MGCKYRVGVLYSGNTSTKAMRKVCACHIGTCSESRGMQRGMGQYCLEFIGTCKSIGFN